MSEFNLGFSGIFNQIRATANYGTIRPGPEEKMNSDIHIEKASVQLSSFPALSLMDELQRKIFFVEKKKPEPGQIQAVETFSTISCVHPKVTH